VTQARRGLRAPRIGVVTEFDDQRGLGVVSAEDGSSYRFHCTALSDGTRTVDVGTRVVFVVAAGHGGRDEALAITPVGPR
jgi:cold shock CspA family protein